MHDIVLLSTSSLGLLVEGLPIVSLAVFGCVMYSMPFEEHWTLPFFAHC